MDPIINDELRKHAILQATANLPASNRGDSARNKPTVRDVTEYAGLDGNSCLNLVDTLNQDGLLYVMLSKGARDTARAGLGMVVSITTKGLEYLASIDENELQNSPSKATGNSRSLVLSAASVLSSIGEYQESIKVNNRIAVEHPEHREELMRFLVKLQHALSELIETVPGSLEDNELATDREIIKWRKKYWSSLQRELKAYTSPESMAKITLPGSIILGAGGIGAMCGGPVGFGIGVIAGKWVTGEAKAGVVINNVEKALQEAEGTTED